MTAKEPQASEYDGHQHVGVDLHRRRSVTVRQTDDGVPLSAVCILNDPVALGLRIEQAGPDPDVVREAPPTAGTGRPTSCKPPEHASTWPTRCA
ncbi:hypothetical protein [Streptomyces monashensis]|uniref:hypothetical protein n=1 Tax=Streptomyces monashensis TaxID=1678012 RepID=UPI001FEBE936|nr:hypothetical protein [Streptomyces monashensis]